VIPMVQDRPPEEVNPARRLDLLSRVAPLLLLSLVLLLGVRIPAPLNRILESAAASLGGKP
jgi:hypothetical protein